MTCNLNNPLHRRRQAKLHTRSGAAVVEFAVCLPVIMMLVLGAIEATSMIFLQQSLTAAAYEGVREATRVAATDEAARRVAENVLTTRQVKNFTVSFTPNPSTATRGQRVVVNVTAPVSQNSPFIGHVLKDRVLSAQATMLKE